MRVLSTLITCIALGAAAQARPTERERDPNDCTVLKSVKLSFYGRENHRDPLAYPECGRNFAGGKGTFESPLSAAAAPGAFEKCSVVYIPYLLKYVRFDDVCTDCVMDYSKGKLHLKIWTGNSMAGGQEHLQCMKDLTPSYAMSVVHKPSKALIVDQTPLYKWGAWNSCALDHRYTVVNNNAFCFSLEDDPASHHDDERNSASAMRHPYPRPEEHSQQESQPEEQAPEVSEAQRNALDVAAAAASSGWALSQAPEGGQRVMSDGLGTESQWSLQQDT